MPDGVCLTFNTVNKMWHIHISNRRCPLKKPGGNKVDSDHAKLMTVSVTVRANGVPACVSELSQKGSFFLTLTPTLPIFSLYAFASSRKSLSEKWGGDPLAGSCLTSFSGCAPQLNAGQKQVPALSLLFISPHSPANETHLLSSCRC